MMVCANHPGTETKVSCSNCGKPICPRCMVFMPVGVKCAECARPAPGALARGKPLQYAGAIGAGLAAGLIAGLAAGELSGLIRGLTIIISLGLGYAVGRAVRFGAQGNRGLVFSAIAGLAGLLGALVAFGPAIASPFGLLAVLISSGVAAAMARD